MSEKSYSVNSEYHGKPITPLAKQIAGSAPSSSNSLSTDSSSLVDLKAEVFRKQQEAKFNKVHFGSLRLKNSSDKSKATNKDKIWSKKNAGLTSREKKDLEVEKEKLQYLRHRLFNRCNKQMLNMGLFHFLPTKIGKFISQSETDNLFGRKHMD